jgi:hypothetical protein
VTHTSFSRGAEVQFAERGCCSRAGYSNSLEPCSLPLFLEAAAAATNSTGEAAMYVILAKFSNFFYFIYSVKPRRIDLYIQP